MSTQIIVPRMKPNPSLKGPSFFGCFNTGLEPTIRRAVRTGWPAEKKELWFVGPDLCTSEVRNKFMRFGIDEKKRIHKNEFGRVCYVYKTRSSAVKKFRSLCNAVIENNKQLAAEAESLRKRAAKGDLGAALELGDY